jgi:hypothetical protein
MLRTQWGKVKHHDNETPEVSIAFTKPKTTSRPETPAKKKAVLPKASPSLRPKQQIVMYAAKPRKVAKENKTTSFQRSQSLVSIQSLPSDKPSERACSILQYLDESQLECANVTSIETPSVPKAEAAKYRTELKETVKTMAALKSTVQRQKIRLKERIEEVKTACEQRLAAQKAEFDSLAEQNMDFIRSLLDEKEEFLKQQTEVTRRLKEQERKHTKEQEELKTRLEKELRKQKETASERTRRERLLNKDLEEATVKGLDPEVARIVIDQRQVIESIQEEHREQIQFLKEDLTQHHINQIHEVREEAVKETQRCIEQERKTHADEISEIIRKHQAEMEVERQRMNDGIAKEQGRADRAVEAVEEQWRRRVGELELGWHSKLQSVMAEHKNCAEDNKRRYSIEIKRFRDELSEEMAVWLETQNSRLAEATAEKEAEAQKVIQRLSEELSNVTTKYNSEVVDRLQTATDSAYSEIQDLLGRLKVLEEQATQAHTRAAQWETEAVKLGQEREALAASLKEQDQLIKELQRHVEVLDQKNKSLESTLMQTEQRHTDELELKDKSVQSTLKLAEQSHEVTQCRLMSELKHAHELSVTLQATHQRELEALSQREAEGYAAIEHRVRQTIQKKDEQIQRLTESLKVAQVKVRKLEELLEAQRIELTLINP